MWLYINTTAFYNHDQERKKEQEQVLEMNVEEDSFTPETR